MRSFLIALVVLFGCLGQAHATAAYVQQCAAPGQGSGTTMTCTMGATPVVGDILILGITDNTATALSSVVTTNVTWTHISAADSSYGGGYNLYSGIWCGVVGASPGSATTATFPSTLTNNQSQEITEIEVSGIGSCSRILSAGGSGSTLTPTTGGLAPYAFNTVIFACSRANVGFSTGPSNSFSAITQDATSAADASAYFIANPASGSSYSTSWTLDGSAPWATSTVAFIVVNDGFMPFV